MANRLPVLKSINVCTEVLIFSRHILTLAQSIDTFSGQLTLDIGHSLVIFRSLKFTILSAGVEGNSTSMDEREGDMIKSPTRNWIPPTWVRAVEMIPFSLSSLSITLPRRVQSTAFKTMHPPYRNAMTALKGETPTSVMCMPANDDWI